LSGCSKPNASASRTWKKLAERVVGQPEAVRAVSKRCGARELAEGPGPPDRSSCFSPTGVGKPSGQGLAEFLFDDENAITRSTCRSTWSATPSRAYRLAPVMSAMTTAAPCREDPPPAVSGRAARRVEKAHPDVLNVLLQH